MTNSITYSILKYSHSKILGEELNIGILFVIPEEGIIEFRYPSRLSRISRTYPNASLGLIKDYLKSFDKISKKLSGKINLYSFNLNDILDEHYVITDDSALQFTKFHYSLYYEKSKEEVFDKYFNIFLNPYENLSKSDVKKTTDSDIVKKFTSLVLDVDPSIKDYLMKDRNIISHNHIRFKTDFYWKNGTTNYVKGVSFDLNTEQSIIDKSLLIENQLNYVNGEISDSNSRVDLLISKPKNPEFRDTYLEALDILQNANTNKDIIKNGEINSYAEKVIDSIERD